MSKSVLWPLALWCLSCASETPDKEASTTLPAKPQEKAGVEAERGEGYRVDIINWHRWGTPTTVAAIANKPHNPLLIYLAAPGCDGLFANAGAALRLLAQERFIPIRVNPFHHPHVARRYGNAGWPALAVAHSDGRLISSATDIPPGNVRTFLRQTRKHLDERSETIERKLRLSARSPSPVGSVTAATLFNSIGDDFDPLHAGFGTGVKFPEPLVLQFLIEYGVRRRVDTALDLARRSLEALLTSPVWDDERGGIFIYSLTRDWLTPVYEKDSFDQAELLTALVEMISSNRGGSAQAMFEERARQLMSSCLGTELFDEKRGVYGGRRVQLADGRWWTDPAVYADRNSSVIIAVLRAAAILDDEPSVLKALAAARYIMDHSVGESGVVYHCLSGDEALAPGLLADQFLVALALTEAHRWSGEGAFASTAAAVRTWAEENLLETATGRFFDSRPPREWGAGWELIQPFEDGNRAAGNVLAARLHLRQKETDRAADILKGAIVPEAGRSVASLGTTLLRIGGS